MEMLLNSKHTGIFPGSGSTSGADALAFAREGISIPELQTVFSRRVITPNDPGYDQACTVFYGGIDRRPEIIIRAADATEVAHIVSLARATRDHPLTTWRSTATARSEKRSRQRTLTSR